MQAPLDTAHVQKLLAQLLEHGFGELRIQVRDHVIFNIVPMPILKRPAEAEGVQFFVDSLKNAC